MAGRDQALRAVNDRARASLQDEFTRLQLPDSLPKQAAGVHQPGGESTVRHCRPPPMDPRGHRSFNRPRIGHTGRLDLDLSPAAQPCVVRSRCVPGVHAESMRTDARSAPNSGSGWRRLPQPMRMARDAVAQRRARGFALAHGAENTQGRSSLARGWRLGVALPCTCRHVRLPPLRVVAASPSNQRRQHLQQQTADRHLHRRHREQR